MFMNKKEKSHASFVWFFSWSNSSEKDRTGAWESMSIKGRFNLYHLFSNNFSILMYLLMSSINSLGAKWGLSYLTIGLINFVGGLSYVGASLVLGRLGDRLGHKRILIGATFLFAVFNVAGFFWTNVFELFVFSAGLNVFFGTFFPQIEGLLSKEEKILGIDPANTINRFNVSWITGNMVGMAMGPFLIVRFPYVVFSYGIILNLVAFFVLKRDYSKNSEALSFDPLPELKKPSKEIDFPKISLYRKVYRFTLFMFGLVYAAVMSLFPKVISMEGMPVSLTGFIIVGGNIGVFLTFIFLGRIRAWIGKPKVAGLFLLVFPLMTFFIFMPTSPAIFFVIAFFAGMGYATPYTYAIFYGLNSPDRDQGKQGGFHEAIMGTIWGLGPFFGALTIQLSSGFIGLGILAILISLIIFIVQIRFFKRL